MFCESEQETEDNRNQKIHLLGGSALRAGISGAHRPLYFKGVEKKRKMQHGDGNYLYLDLYGIPLT